MAAATAAQPSVDELEKKEEDLFRTGPLSVLTMSVKTNSQACSARAEAGPGSRACPGRVAATQHAARALAVRCRGGWQAHSQARLSVLPLRGLPNVRALPACRLRAGADQLQKQPQAAGAGQGL